MIKTKKCKFCQSEIDDKCKKCPVCKEWLDKKSNPSIYIIVAVFIAYFLIFNDSDKSIEKTTLKRQNYEFQTAEYHKLKVLWHKPENNDGNEKYIIGEIKNEGKDTFDSINIEASFYDKDKNLIKIGSHYISKKFKPGSTAKFQIIYLCGMCEIKKMYDSYQVEIIHASMPFRY